MSPLLSNYRRVFDYVSCVYTCTCTVPVKRKLKYRTVTVPYLKSTTSEPRANHDRTTSEPLKCGSVRCGTVRCGTVRCGAVRYGSVRGR